MRAILESIQRGDLMANCDLVISDRGAAEGISIAQSHGIPTQVIDYSAADPEANEAQLVAALQSAGVELVILAGFMRLLRGPLLRAYPNRILNIHPSLLPKYKGLHAQKQALEAGDLESGCSVHVVTQAMDSGPILLQCQVPILAEDTVDQLSDRILAAEHDAYPKAIQSYIQEVFYESVD